MNAVANRSSGVEAVRFPRSSIASRRRIFSPEPARLSEDLIVEGASRRVRGMQMRPGGAKDLFQREDRMVCRRLWHA